MSAHHPLTPPDELLEHWCAVGKLGNWQNALALAYRAGADQELEACCEWLKDFPHFVGIEEQLRAARRPKPPSLKEQSLALVEQHEEGWRPSPKDWDTIRRALEALDD